MSAPILPGYRELEIGEVIKSTDLLCPKEKNKFRPFKKDSSALGKPYKDKGTPLFPETVIIRKVEIPNLNIYCERIDKIPGAENLIYGLCRKHPIYSKYRFGDFDRRNFYILTNWCGEIGGNHIGTDNGGYECYESRGVKMISYLELIKLLGGEIPKQKPMMIRLVMDITLMPVE